MEAAVQTINSAAATQAVHGVTIAPKAATMVNARSAAEAFAVTSMANSAVPTTNATKQR
jgi:hypothetical protein